METVTITKAEYEEYQRLQKEEQREVQTLRAQMSIQQRQARQLASAVLIAIADEDGAVKLSDAPSAQKAIRLAEDILF